jgi:putative transposase
MRQSYVSIWFHLVWSTKNRERFIQDAWKWQLYSHMKEYCKEKDYYLDFVNGMPDHVHLLISPKPTFALSDIVRNIKTNSYYWLKESRLVDDSFGWQDGYGAFSVSPSMLPQVRNYIKNQEKHHKTKTFEEEMEWFEQIAE